MPPTPIRAGGIFYAERASTSESRDAGGSGFFRGGLLGGVIRAMEIAALMLATDAYWNFLDFPAFFQKGSNLQGDGRIRGNCNRGFLAGSGTFDSHGDHYLVLFVLAAQFTTKPILTQEKIVFY